jgi:DNA primase
MPNFETMDVDQDALTLLKAIKGMTYKFADQKYLPFTLADAVVRLDRMFQSNDMTDSEYLEKFKSMVAVIEQYGGTVGVHPKMVQNELA